MSSAASRVAIGVAVLVIALAVAFSIRTAPETDGQRIDRISGELRCPVCQGLSVRDSPSETARSMRDLVAQRVRESRTDQQIRDEFRASYGDWILLEPPLLGLTGLVWLAPLVLLLAGCGLAWRFARGSPQVTLEEPEAARLAALRERVSSEEAIDA